MQDPLLAFGWSPGGPADENIVPLYRYVYSPDDIGSIDNAAQWLQAQPSGRRGIIVINAPSYNLLRFNSAHACRNPQTGSPLPAPYYCPWLEAGTAATRQQYQTFFSRLSARGAQVDTMMVNYEMVTFDFWGSADVGGMAGNPQRYLAIQNDPRFLQDDTRYPIGDVRRRSIASQLGFSDLSRVFNWHSGDTGTPFHAVWNSLMYDRIAAYTNEAIYEPARQYFPNIKFSDNPYHIQDPSFNIPDSLGAPVSWCESPYYCSARHNVGSHQNPTIGYEPMILSAFEQGAILFDGVRPYRPSSFNTLRFIANKFRTMRLSAPEVPVGPTIGCKSFAWDEANEFYQEQLMHAALTGIDLFYLWNPVDPYWTGIVNDCPRINQDNEIVNRILREFNTLAGSQSRQTLVNSLADWYSDWLLTGLRAGERKVWRFTPLEYPATPTRSAITAASTLVATSPLTFETLQNRIVFPEGVLYTPPNRASAKGFWIVQPASAPDPIVTEDAVNSPPILQVQVSPLHPNGLRYVDGTASYDEDGTIVNWEWDFNNDGITQWYEGNVHIPNFWTADIGPEVSSLRLRATDDRGAVSEIVVGVP